MARVAEPITTYAPPPPPPPPAPSRTRSGLVHPNPYTAAGASVLTGSNLRYIDPATGLPMPDPSIAPPPPPSGGGSVPPSGDLYPTLDMSERGGDVFPGLDVPEPPPGPVGPVAPPPPPLPENIEGFRPTPAWAGGGGPAAQGTQARGLPSMGGLSARMPESIAGYRPRAEFLRRGLLASPYARLSQAGQSLQGFLGGGQMQPEFAGAEDPELLRRQQMAAMGMPEWMGF